MRLVTWNCRIGGYWKKAKHMAALSPDILAVQEVESLENVLLLAGDTQPTFRDRVANPEFPRRAIGVFSYTDTKLRAVDVERPAFSFRRYEATRGDLTFNVAAVWPWATKLRRKSYRQVHEGLEAHDAWIRQRPTVLLGDFNANALFNGPNWKDLEKLVGDLGFTSAYHRFHSEKFGQERRLTYWHRGKSVSGFHLDYCFVPEAWAQKIRTVTVGTHAEWHAVSDHAPLIVDLDV